MTQNEHENGVENRFADSPISRRMFARLSAATIGAAVALPGNAMADASSSAMTERYRYVTNHTPADFAVPTLVRFSDTSGPEAMTGAVDTEVITTQEPEPAAFAPLTTAQAETVAALPTAEELSHSPGSNPFWRLGYYPLGVFPEPRRSTGFIDYEQMIDGMEYLQENHSTYLNFYSLADPEEANTPTTSGKSPGHYNYLSDQINPKDLYVAEVTNFDSDTAFEDKEKVMYSLSLHGLERAGSEAGSRFIEDLLTGNKPSNDPPGPEVSKSDLDDLVLIFLYPNPDGWVAKHPQYESGWQLLGPRGGIPAGPFYERGTAGVYDSNRQYPTIGWIDAQHYHAEPEGAPEYVHQRAPDALSFVEHFRAYENLNYGADLHGALWLPEFVLGLISQHEFTNQQFHELYQMNRVIDQELEAALDRWATVGGVKQDLVGDDNVYPLGYGLLPEQAFDYSTIWDTIGYTVSGALGDWMAHPEELGGLGMTTMDFEMAYSHMVGANVYNPELVEMQVTGYRTAIRTIADYAKRTVETEIRTGGADVAYVVCDDLTRTSDQLEFPDDTEMRTEEFSGVAGPGVGGSGDTREHSFETEETDYEVYAYLTWTPEEQDFDLTLQDPDGNTVASSAEGFSQHEEIDAHIEGGGVYTLVVEPFANVAAEYELTVEIYRSGTAGSSSSDQQISLVSTATGTATHEVGGDAAELSVTVQHSPTVLAAVELVNPEGETVTSFDPAERDRYRGEVPPLSVTDPAPGTWTVEVENISEAPGEARVLFGTVGGNGLGPNPQHALGYEQRDYAVSPFVYFDKEYLDDHDLRRQTVESDYGDDMDGGSLTAVTTQEVAQGALTRGRQPAYDHVIVIHDIFNESGGRSRADYVAALDDYVDTQSGNLILTDTGLRLLQEMNTDLAAGVGDGDVTTDLFEIAHVATKSTDHALLQDTRPIQQMLWKVAPLGYKYSTAASIPMQRIVQDAFTSPAAGEASVAGTTGGQVVLGSLTWEAEGSTGIHVIGGLFPPANQDRLHPFGVLDYAVSFFGHTILTNALGFQQVRKVDGEVVATFGEVDTNDSNAGQSQQGRSGSAPPSRADGGAEVTEG